MQNNYQFGKKALYDAIKNHVPLCQVFLGIANQEIIQTCKKQQIKYQIVNKNWFNNFDKNLNHQFVAFEIKNQIVASTQQKVSLVDFLQKHQNQANLKIVILDEIEDSRNFGAILRSCAAFEIDAVIYKKDHQAPLNDWAIKTSMGAINYLTLIEVVNLNNTIKILKDWGFWIYGTLLDTHSQSLYNVQFSNRCVLIFGNENKGISNLLSKNLDFKIYIPMNHQVQSLNVSVATGICLSYLFEQIKK